MVETVKDTVSEVADEVIPEVPSIDEVKGALPEIEIPEVKIPENVEKGVEEVKDKINEFIK